MTEKGLSQVVSSILLVVVAISLIVMAYLWVSGIQSKALISGERQTQEATNRDELEVQSIRLDAAGDNILALYVKNKSEHDVGGIAIFVGGTKVDCTAGQDEILAGDVKIFTPTICPTLDDVDVRDRSTSITISSRNGSTTSRLSDLLRQV